MRRFLRRDADTGICHLQPHPGQPIAPLHQLSRYGHNAAGLVVFDAVFHQIKNHLIQPVLVKQREKSRRNLVFQPNLGLKGGFPQQIGYFAGQFVQIAARGRGGRAVVQSGQLQKPLGNSGQSVNFLVDIPQKFIHRLSADALGLQNRIGQQLDGGQRRFQLVRSVGNKLLPQLFGFLQPAGQLIEFAGQFGQLVLPVHMDSGVIVAAAHLANASHQPVNALAKISDKKAQHRAAQHRQQQRDAEDVAPRAAQKIRLLGVVIVDIHRPNGFFPLHHRHGGAGGKRLLVIPAAKDVGSLQRRYKIGQQSVAACQRADLGVVVQHAAKTVRHQNPLLLFQFQHLNRQHNIVLRQRGKAFQRQRQPLGPLQQFGLLGADDQPSHRLRRVKIHHRQQRGHNGRHGGGDAEAQAFGEFSCRWI